MRKCFLVFRIQPSCTEVGNDEQTLFLSKELMKKGIYTNPILYPAVSRGDARIRMSLSALHTKGQLDYTLSTINNLLNNT